MDEDGEDNQMEISNWQIGLSIPFYKRKYCVTLFTINWRILLYCICDCHIEMFM
jgi:hypothetical protein